MKRRSLLAALGAAPAASLAWPALNVPAAASPIDLEGIEFPEDPEIGDIFMWSEMPRLTSETLNPSPGRYAAFFYRGDGWMEMARPPTMTIKLLEDL